MYNGKMMRGGYHRRDIAMVDYLKAICIIFVICNHSGLFDKTKPVFLLTIDKAVPVFMLLSGYVLAVSAEDRQLREMYREDRMERKFLRYTVPILITFLLWLVLKRISGDVLSPYEIVESFCLGRYGAGSYYYQLMVQFLLLSPVLLWTVRRTGTDGVVLAGLLNFFFDICSSTYHLRPSLYRVLIFRYLLAVALGVYMGLHRDMKIGIKNIVLMLAAGIGYILLPSYWGYEYRIFTFDPWERTSMISMLYVFPVVYMLFRHLGQYKSRTLLGKSVETIGRASYHIMCTQMIYYAVRPTFDAMIFDIACLGAAGELAVNIVVAVVTGTAFWYVDEHYITGGLLKIWKKSTTT